MAAMQLHGLVFGLLLRPRPSSLQKKYNSSYEDNSSKMIPKLSGDSLEGDNQLKPHKQTISDYSSINSSLASGFVSEAQSSFQSHQDHYNGSSQITVSTESNFVFGNWKHYPFKSIQSCFACSYFFYITGLAFLPSY